MTDVVLRPVIGSQIEWIIHVWRKSDFSGGQSWRSRRKWVSSDFPECLLETQDVEVLPSSAGCRVPVLQASSSCLASDVSGRSQRQRSCLSCIFRCVMPKRSYVLGCWKNSNYEVAWICSHATNWIQLVVELTISITKHCQMFLRLKVTKHLSVFSSKSVNPVGN